MISNCGAGFLTSKFVPVVRLRTVKIEVFFSWARETGLLKMDPSAVNRKNFCAIRLPQ